MTNKLFVIGAGASKDFDNEMLLGADIIEKIKQLKFQIYYELVAIVAVKIAVSEMGGSVRAIALNTVIQKFLQKNHDFLQVDQFKEKKGNPQIIEEFIQDLEVVLDIHGFLGKWQKNEIVTRSIKFLINENKYINTFNTLVQFRLSHLGLEHGAKEAVNIFYKSVDDILNFVFAPIKAGGSKNWKNVRKELLNELKRYVIHGIILSEIVERFDSVIYSIDHLINFLTSVTHYSDKYTESLDLPSADKIKEFAIEYTANILGKSTKGYSSNKNWIEYLEKEIFLDRDQRLESKVNEVSLINFNYDVLIEQHFNHKLSLSNSEIRQNSLNEFIKKASDSHIYGVIRYYGGSHGLIENIIDNTNWIISDYTKQKKQTTYGTSDNFEKKIIKEKSIDKLKKIKEDLIETRENRKINFIRTDSDFKEIKERFEKINNSNKIYFLGFGFDSWNLKNIGIYDENFNLTKEARSIRGKSVYVTNYGDLPKIRIILEKIFNIELYKDNETTEWKKIGKKEREIKYSFWRSKDIHSTGNQVFVSTKPVYRALTEDFD